MAAIVTVNEGDIEHGGGSFFIVTGTIAFSGSYSATEALSFAVQNLPVTKAPKHVHIYGLAGYVYTYQRAATAPNAANGEVQVWHADYDAVADGALIEIPVAAYPAGVSGDTVRFMAVFERE